MSTARFDEDDVMTYLLSKTGTAQGELADEDIVSIHSAQQTWSAWQTVIRFAVNPGHVLDAFDQQDLQKAQKFLGIREGNDEDEYGSEGL